MIRKNPGTIGLIPSKVAFRFFCFFIAFFRFDGFDIRFDSIDTASERLVRWSVDEGGPFGKKTVFYVKAIT